MSRKPLTKNKVVGLMTYVKPQFEKLVRLIAIAYFGDESRVSGAMNLALNPFGGSGLLNSTYTSPNDLGDMINSKFSNFLIHFANEKGQTK